MAAIGGLAGGVGIGAMLAGVAQADLAIMPARTAPTPWIKTSPLVIYLGYLVQVTDKIFHCPSILHTCQCSRPALVTLPFATNS